MAKKILFYSSVTSTDLFINQDFYAIDIAILKTLGYSVTTTNNWTDFLYSSKYDIAFLYFYKKSFLPGLLSKFFNKKVFYTGGIDDLNLESTEKVRYYLQIILFRICYYSADTLFICSYSDMNNIKKIKSNSWDKCTVTYHTIDFPELNYDVKVKKENIMCSIAWLGSIRNTKRKGLDIAIRVFSELKKSKYFKDYIFYIIGNGDIGTEYLKKLVIKYELQDSVKFLRGISNKDKFQILQISKYYLQLSSYEGFGLACLEALYCGNLVVHSNNGALKETMPPEQIKFNLNNTFSYETKVLIDTLREIDSKYFLEDNQKIFKEYVEKVFASKKRLLDFNSLI